MMKKQEQAAAVPRGAAGAGSGDFPESAGHRFGRYAIRTGDVLLNIVIALIVIVMLLYATYSIWDNYRIIHSADAAQFTKYSPAVDPLTFQDFAAANPDVIGWLTVPDTQIDYPLVQGTDEMYYLSHDALGNESMTGSLFLTKENAPDFSGFNSIIYGHHMVAEKMFGDLDLFKDETFFNGHLTAKIYYDASRKAGAGYSAGGSWAWHDVFLTALVSADAYDGSWYTPGITDEAARQSFLDRMKTDSVYYREIGLTTGDHLIEMSTCVSQETNGRIILIGKIVQ